MADRKPTQSKSWFVRAYRHTVVLLQAAWVNAIIARLLEAGQKRAGAAAARSRTVGLYKTVGQWLYRQICQSAIYRWLTAEPETDVIVIDLRDSKTFGPLITSLDLLVSHVSRWWEHARVQSWVDTVPTQVSRSALSQSLAYRLAYTVLIPPESADRGGGRTRNEGDAAESDCHTDDDQTDYRETNRR